jgi:hypothetical protein
VWVSKVFGAKWNFYVGYDVVSLVNNRKSRGDSFENVAFEFPPCESYIALNTYIKFQLEIANTLF